MQAFYTNVSRAGKFLLVRGHLADGKAFKERISYKPYHFVRCDTPSEYRDTDGNFVSRVDFDSMWDAKDFIEKYADVDNFPVYGFRRYEYNYIYDEYRNQKHDVTKVSVVYIDIECKSEAGFPRPEYADQELTAISLRKGDLKITLGVVDFVSNDPNLVYIKCRDEIDLIYKFLDAWEKLAPDVVTGWNVEFFDIPYLINRITNVLSEDVAKKMSPWNQLRSYSVKDKWGKESSSYEMIGITTLDLMAAYKKFSFKNQESYSLNHIAQVELKEKKLEYEGTLTTLYRDDPQKFIEYNILDNDLVFRIAKKTGLLEQIMEMAYDAGVNFADAFGSVLFWEVIIKNHLLKKGQVVRAVGKRNRKLAPIMGAFVKEPVPKLYKWVVGLDLDSLYPHLIMQYNISPETLVKRVRSLTNSMPISDILDGRLLQDHTIASNIAQGYGYTPNGMFFRNDVRGFLPELMDAYYADRKSFKKKMGKARAEKEKATDPIEITRLEADITRFNNIQMAKKIALNSAYGALSNEWCLWYDLDLAEAITYSGQLAIKWVAKKMNEYFNRLLKTKGLDYVIASDTDSAYLVLDKLVAATFGKDYDKKKVVEFLSKICEEKINPAINEFYDELAKMTNAYENKMSMKVESISETGMWTKKKRYALLMWWDEGVFLNEAAVKIKGLEAVQSSTPAICRTKIKKAVEHVLRGQKNELYDLVNKFEVEFKKASFMEVGATVAPSEIEKYDAGGGKVMPRAPIWVRGAIVYNFALRDHGLERKYRRINNGDKIKYSYMKTPNPYGQNVFAALDELPAELNMSGYIDYDKQFKVEFVGPVNKLANLAGWDIENMNTIESFFA